jgi:NhaA family Na+:H+ antiporter
VVALILMMQRLQWRQPVLSVVPAIALWVCVLESGVHATIAGVVLGLLTPARPFGGYDLIENLENRTHPWSSFLVIPVFALANAGLRLDAASIERAATSRIAWGIVLGLVVGKPLGILVATRFGVHSGIGRLQEGLAFRHVVGLGCVAGIGFTVSLFVAELSFHASLLSEAKTGILAASLMSALVGVSWLLLSRRRATTRRAVGGYDAA